MIMQFKTKLFSLLLILLYSYICLSAKEEKTKLITRTKVLGLSIKFIKKCFKDELLNNNSKILSSNIKISTIIPVYNCKKTIKASVRSIQNQNMSDIEIILVNDNSNDNTSLIIQKLAEEDKRIKILNNKKNKAIIGFNAIDCRNYNPLITQMNDALLHDHKEGLTLYQPELTYFPISRNTKFKPNDLHVWGRLVKENAYKKAINNFGKNAIGEIRNLCFVTWNEDSAMSMALFKYAESYKFIQKYGIFHYKGKSTSSKTSSIDLKKYGELFFIDTVFDFSHNNFRGKKYSVEMAHKLIFPHINSLSEKNKKYLKAILYKMLDCQYISYADKKEIKLNLEKIEL